MLTEKHISYLAEIAADQQKSRDELHAAIEQAARNTSEIYREAEERRAREEAAKPGPRDRDLADAIIRLLKNEALRAEIKTALAQ
jgi:hypothetical protein